MGDGYNVFTYKLASLLVWGIDSTGGRGIGNVSTKYGDTMVDAYHSNHPFAMGLDLWLNQAWGAISYPV